MFIAFFIFTTKEIENSCRIKIAADKNIEFIDDFVEKHYKEI